MALNYMIKRELPDVPFTIELHKSLYKKWMEDYSVKEFLKGGQFHETPEKFGDPKWASAISNNHYQTHPVHPRRMRKFLQGYVYLRDNEDGTMYIAHFEPVVPSNQSGYDNDIID